MFPDCVSGLRTTSHRRCDVILGIIWNTTLDDITSSALNMTSKRDDIIITAGFYIHLILGSPICILGLIGSTIAYIVLAYEKYSPISSFLLRMLCVSDNCVLLLSIIYNSLPAAFKYWQIEDELPYSWYCILLTSEVLIYIAQFVNIWLTVLIAAVRYIAVCRPLHANHLLSLFRAKCAVVGLIVITLVLHGPCFFEQRISVRTVSHNPLKTSYFLEYRPFTMEYTYLWIHSTILVSICYFILPFILLSILSVKLLLAYKSSVLIHKEMTQTEKSENQLTLIMIIIILIFLIFQLPLRIADLLYWHTTLYTSSPGHSFMVAYELMCLLIVLNSAVNFVVYCACRSEFRASLRHLCCRRLVPSLRHSFRSIVSAPEVTTV